MIGILSDAHGNIAALRTALERLGELGVQRLYYLGDAVGYLGSLEVLTALQGLGSAVRCVRGNHEEMLLGGPIDPAKEAIVRLDGPRRQLTPQLRAYVAGWPSVLRERIGEARILFIHGSPADFTRGYLYPQTDLSMIEVAEDYVFMGHTHQPFVGSNDRTTFVNVGSVGLPRDDGRYGSFATFEATSGEVAIYRFSLTGSAAPVLAADAQVHPAVRALFLRRRTDPVGKVLG